MTTFRADLKRVGRQLFGKVEVAHDQCRAGNAGTRISTFCRVSQALGERAGNCKAAVHLFDVPRAGRQTPYARQAAPTSRTGSPSRSALASASAVWASNRSSRDGTCSEMKMRPLTRTMTASSPEDSATATASSASVGGVRVSSVSELGAQRGQHERSFGLVRRQRVEGHLQDLDLVGVDHADGADRSPGCWRGRRRRAGRCHRDPPPGERRR